MKIQIAILEDNKSHCEQLEMILNNWALKNGHSISISCFDNEHDIITNASRNKFDLLFSDIELDNSNGIAICSSLRDNGFTGDIIFITSYSEYVFQGYNVKAVNYILKPISEDAINKCMNTYLSYHKNSSYHFCKNNDIILIPYNDIICIYKTCHDCFINTTSQLYTQRGSLKDFENTFPKQFIRCHKSCIVNVNHIASFSNGIIKLSNKQTQVVGRLYISNVKKALFDMMNSCIGI